jgi:hypothetical protein
VVTRQGALQGTSKVWAVWLHGVSRADRYSPGTRRQGCRFHGWYWQVRKDTQRDLPLPLELPLKNMKNALTPSGVPPVSRYVLEMVGRHTRGPVRQEDLASFLNLVDGGARA